MLMQRDRAVCVYVCIMLLEQRSVYSHTNTQHKEPAVTSTGPGGTAFTVEQQEWSVSMRGCRRQIELKPD